MSILEDVKDRLEKATGIGRPKRDALKDLCRPRKPYAFHFRDDGLTPNNPRLPMIVYRSPVKLADDLDPAAIFEDVFAANGWKDSWRDGIYDFLHYHSRSHEVLGIARGQARVRFGGDVGRVLRIKAGDVIIMPAGTGHQRLSASRDLLVVGAYPAGSIYDECRSTEKNHDAAARRIAKLKRPARDPVYGADGPLVRLWKTK